MAKKRPRSKKRDCLFSFWKFYVNAKHSVAKCNNTQTFIKFLNILEFVEFYPSMVDKFG
jgi:hypothetical protein